MSWSLFKANVRANRIIWLIMTAVFLFYFSFIGSMYNPEESDAMRDMMEMIPETMLKAMGWNMEDTSLLALIISYMYGLLLFMFPLVISIVVNHRLIASHVDKGSMAYLLSTPNSRKTIVLTQAVFSIASISLFFVLVTVFGLLMMQAMLPGELETGKFVLLNLYALVLYYAIGGIGFLASCIANESKTSLGIGIGVPAAFFVLRLLGNSHESLSWIGNLSMFALYDPDKILVGSSFVWVGMAAFGLIAVALYGGGIVYFNKRDLSI